MDYACNTLTLNPVRMLCVPQPDRVRFDEAKAQRLYNDGLNDVEIAEACGGVRHQDISRWRREQGLPSNYAKRFWSGQEEKGEWQPTRPVLIRTYEENGHVVKVYEPRYVFGG
jgi:hypothetical protein